MARIRYVKPDFFADTRLAEVSVEARILYIGLWCWMDKQGIAEDDPRLIKRNIFSYDDRLTIKRIVLLLNELCNIGRLIRIDYDGQKYLFCPTFTEHQKFHPGEPEKYKIPKDLLKTTYKQVANHLQDSYSQAANNPLTLTLTGTLTGTGTGTGTAEVGSTSAESVIPELLDSLTHELLGKTTVAIQRSWLATYQEPEWLREEFRKAVNWIHANPKKAPKSDFARFLNNWLSRGWEKHRKGVPANTKTAADVWLEKKQHEEAEQAL